MEKFYIRGMEQLGIGVTDVHAAWKWYRENFGADIKILDDDSEAKYMLRYTGGVPHRRHAILAVSLQGGGGFEIWQYKSHESTKPLFDIQLGDLGIFAGKIKTDNLEKAQTFFKAKTDGTKTSEMVTDPKGEKYFWTDRKRYMGMPLSFTRYALSEDRLFLSIGFFSVKDEEILLYRVRDISVQRTLWQRIFGVGSYPICCQQLRFPL